MPDTTAERRSALRRPQVLTTEVVALPRGAKLFARTSNVRRSGCYVDTLNPLPNGSKVRLRITHHDEVFEGVGRIVYVSPAWAWTLRLKPSPRRSRPSCSDGSRLPKNTLHVAQKEAGADRAI
jgi:hypothetical protein